MVDQCRALVRNYRSGAASAAREGVNVTFTLSAEQCARSCAPTLVYQLTMQLTEIEVLSSSPAKMTLLLATHRPHTLGGSHAPGMFSHHSSCWTAFFDPGQA